MLVSKPFPGRKTTFISAASHELRSPLIGVANALQLRKMAKSEEEEREFFELAMEKATIRVASYQ